MEQGAKTSLILRFFFQVSRHLRKVVAGIFLVERHRGGSMSLSDWASIAIIVQGIFLVVSVGLVWFQLRENTKLVRAANTQTLVELSSPFYFQLAQDRALTEIWRRGTERLDELDEIDRERYFSLLTWWLMLHENIYHQWKRKLVDEDTFVSWTRDLEYFARRQRLEKHWSRFGNYFEASFAEHVTSIIVSQTKEVEYTETGGKPAI
jgi:hypothetical protein